MNAPIKSSSIEFGFVMKKCDKDERGREIEKVMGKFTISGHSKRG